MKIKLTLLLNIAFLLLLTACHDDDYFEPSIDGSFKVHSFDGGHPVIIDPYVNDGVFEISWSLRPEYPPVDILIRLGKSRHPRSSDIILIDRTYDINSSDRRVRGRPGFQYTTSNELLRIEDDGSVTFLEDLTDWSPYSQDLYVHFDACQRKGGCYRATEEVVFW